MDLPGPGSHDFLRQFRGLAILQGISGLAYEFGSKVTATVMVLSLPGANFHWRTAFSAESANAGFPPSTSTSFTLPSAWMATFKRTVPPMPLRFQIEGYCASTFFTTLRSASCARAGVRQRAPKTSHPHTVA